MHRPCLRLDMNVEDPCRHRALGSRNEFRLEVEEPAETRQQLVFHRRVHPGRHDLLKRSRSSRRELDVLLLPGTPSNNLDVEIMRVAQVVNNAVTSANVHRVDTELDTSATALSALLHAL